jgi:UDP-glucuronate decarboxylase
MEYHRQHGIDTRIARIFNTYGPRMSEHDGRVVSNFIVQALRGEPLTIYGDGSQTRAFCYVDDLVNGLVRLMEAEAAVPTIHEPVNLGNPGEFTIRELADEVARLCARKPRLVFKPLPQDDPTQRRPDITRARELLGWEPTVPLRVGLKRTLAYFRQRLEQGADRDRRLSAAAGRTAGAAGGAGAAGAAFVDRRRPVETATWLEQSLG